MTTPSRRKLMNAHELGSLSSMGGLRAVGDYASEWIEIEITVDSGAVMPASACHSISVLASRQYMEGVGYDVANGETYPTSGRDDA